MRRRLPLRRKPELPGDGHPIIVISSAVDAVATGDARFNGGVKIYNQWVKLLRQHGYPAFIATFDGAHTDWLLDHQPHVPLATVARWRAGGLPIVYVTGWLDARAFAGLADRLRFYDCEMAYTVGPHRRLFDRRRRRIDAIATHSRTQQAWYMATYGIEPVLIPIWSDPEFWRPAPERRIRGRVGYMSESPRSADEAEQIRAACEARGIDVSLHLVQGVEREVLEQMQTCEVFVGLNPGKHQLWGEGSPISPQEAMHTGCALVAYDVHGNREYLVDGFDGFVVPRGRPDLLAERVADLLSDRELLARVQARARDLAATSFVPERRWQLVRDFLDLAELEDVAPPQPGALSVKGIEELLEAPVYMNEEEAPVVARHAAAATGPLVEIGAGYGASSLLLLLHGPAGLPVHSIDPFVQDSMVAFRVQPSDWWMNVSRAARKLGAARRLARWTPHLVPSYERVRDWKESISLLFIDGDHRYDAVRRDFAEWSPFVEPGGVVMLHDSRRLPGAPEGEFARGWQGPTQLAEELRGHTCVTLETEAFSLTVWRRTGAACPACEAMRS